MLQASAAAAFMSTLAGPVRAQAWPARPVRLVVPATAGGANEPIARILGTRLSEVWGQPVVVENRPGAAGNVAAEQIARAGPDSYTIFLGSFPLGVNKFLYDSIGYDPIADFTPISLICTTPNVMVVPMSLPVANVGEFIAYAKANPGKINYGSSGHGTAVHLAGELIKRVAGIEMTHVPYRGGAPAIADLIPGRIQLMFAVMPTVLPQVTAGQLRALGVTTARRAPQAPQLPTLAESGLPGFRVGGWFAFFMPARTPPEIVSKVHTDTTAALADPAIRERLESQGMVIIGSTPGELADLLKSELDKWGPIIRDAGIRVTE